MTKVVSIIPPHKDGDTGPHKVQGTHVLLDDGSRLEGVQKVTLVAEVGDVWKAIIELRPVNQKQIDALIEEIKVIEDGKTTAIAEQT